MGLLNTLQEQNKDRANAGGGKANTFGMILSVATATSLEEGQLQLTGVAKTSSSAVKEGEMVTVMFREAQAVQVHNTFKKNLGALTDPERAKGIQVSLEGCYVDQERSEGEVKVLNARWLNTVSNVRANPDHQNRGALDNVYASSPRIIFKNPNKQPGEPDTITFPVVAESISARVKTDNGYGRQNFSRDWALAKLRALPQEQKPQVVMDHLDVESPTKVATLSEMKAALAKALSEGTNSLALMRIYDGDDVVVRSVFPMAKQDGRGEYVPDVDAALAEVFGGKDVFRNVPPAVLEAELAKGTLVAEVIPGYRLRYMGNPRARENSAANLLKDVLEDKVTQLQAIFGNRGDNYAKVIIPGMAHDGTKISGFAVMNVLAHEQGVFSTNDIPTAVIDRRVPLVVPELAAELDDDMSGDDYFPESEGMAADETAVAMRR